jgi:pyridoxine kinase
MKVSSAASTVSTAAAGGGLRLRLGLLLTSLSLSLSLSFLRAPAYHYQRTALRSSSSSGSRRALSFAQVRARPLALANMAEAGSKTQPTAQEAVRAAPRVLSIQSHTVHGYVGNKAATLPLQCLGYNVEMINTVTLSNHPAYPAGTKGQSLDPDLFKDLVAGLASNSLLGYDVILTGYVRSADIMGNISALIRSAREANPNVLVVCDPVLGDNGRYYVPEELKNVYLTSVLPLASVVTPNQFEAEELSGIKIDSLQAARDVCEFFHNLGVSICVLKGLRLPQEKYSIVVSFSGGQGEAALQSKMFRIDVPLFSSRMFSGCGDLFSALTAGMLHRHIGITAAQRIPAEVSVRPSQSSVNHVCFALEQIARAMATVLHTTEYLNSKELCIVECLDTFRSLRSLQPSNAPVAEISEFQQHSFRGN